VVAVDSHVVGSLAQLHAPPARGVLSFAVLVLSAAGTGAVAARLASARRAVERFAQSLERADGELVEANRQLLARGAEIAAAHATLEERTAEADAAREAAESAARWLRRVGESDIVGCTCGTSPATCSTPTTRSCACSGGRATTSRRAA
jgi:hypothetical protein